MLEQQWSLPNALPSASPEHPWVRTHRLAGSPELVPFPVAWSATGCKTWGMLTTPLAMVLVQNRLRQQNIWWGRAGSTWQGSGYGASLPPSSCPGVLGISLVPGTLQHPKHTPLPVLYTAGL